jgi:NADPH-dependent glutamate synthase beta subunit-like oxidoreductase
MTVYDINRILMPEAPSEYIDDTNEGHYVPAPCQVACPVGTDAPSYLAYIWEQKLDEAFEAITATNPFSSICGRVCDAPCEPACRRTDSDGPVQIRNLKRYVMDQLGATWEPQPCPATRNQSIAIVGAGPAGLVAAHDLSVAGFKVDVYEASDRPGGMMVWGIPAFRLPPGIIDQDISRLQKKCPGLDIHLNTALGRNITLQTLKQKHDTVLLTLG